MTFKELFETILRIKCVRGVKLRVFKKESKTDGDKFGVFVRRIESDEYEWEKIGNK